MKALIKVGYACNEHCTFCHTQELREIQGTSADVERKIDRAKALGHTMVVLSGGEPTIRPELMQWAARIAAHGMDLGLVTNGLVLAYPEIVERLLATRLRYVYMSLHAGEADVHDRVVRAESFATAVRALDNLQGRGLQLTINCVVTRGNLGHLRSLVDVIAPRTDAVLKFSAVEPKGGALRLRELVVPRIADAAAAVLDALTYASAVMPGRVRHGGFPLCLLPGFEDRYDDLRTHAYWTMVETDEPDYFPVDDRNKLHPSPTCDDCRLRGPCPGLFRAYHERHGADELRPRADPSEGLRGNAFDWVLETVQPAPAEGCPLRDDGVTPWEPARHLFVRHAGRIARYRASGRDFADDTLARVKHELGQVYLDAGRTPAVDDFARDLVKLVRSEMCTPCPERARCTGMFEPEFSDVFTADDGDLRARLATLRGDVLELGCGRGRTATTWAAGLAAGTLRYSALDPDPEAIAITSAKLPGARLHHGAAEDVVGTLAAASFDHAVALHAWNHLRDPVAVLDALARVLRPGGELWLVDDGVFGLARTRAQHERARRGGAVWQHHRNDDAARAHARIAGGAWTLVERRDIGPTTSNQWLLRYRRSPT